MAKGQELMIARVTGGEKEERPIMDSHI